MKNNRIRGFFTYLLLSLVSILWGFPILWIVISSFKPSSLLSARGLDFIFKPTLEHYLLIFKVQPFLEYARNSFMITIISILMALIIGIPAAYSISRYNTGGKNYSFWIISTRIIPPAVLVVPFFMIFQSLKMFNTWWSLIIIYTMFNLSYIIWMLKDFFDEVPKEIEESARIDGASITQTLMRITLPIARPGIIAVIILAASFAWNEFLFAVILTLDKASKTLPVAANDFVTGYAINWGPLFASGTLIGLPIAIFAFFVQKNIVRGLTLGAVK